MIPWPIAAIMIGANKPLVFMVKRMASSRNSGKVMASQSVRPACCSPHLRQLSLYVVQDATMQFSILGQHPQGVLAHLRYCEEFRGDVSKVESQLQACAVNLNPNVVMGQQQASLGIGGGTAGMRKPGG